MLIHVVQSHRPAWALCQPSGPETPIARRLSSVFVARQLPDAPDRHGEPRQAQATALLDAFRKKVVAAGPISHQIPANRHAEIPCCAVYSFHYSTRLAVADGTGIAAPLRYDCTEHRQPLCCRLVKGKQFYLPGLKYRYKGKYTYASQVTWTRAAIHLQR